MSDYRATISDFGHQRQLSGNRVYNTFLSPDEFVKEQTPPNFSISSFITEAALLWKLLEQQDIFFLHRFLPYKECIKWENTAFSHCQRSDIK